MNSKTIPQTHVVIILVIISSMLSTGLSPFTDKHLIADNSTIKVPVEKQEDIPPEIPAIKPAVIITMHRMIDSGLSSSLKRRLDVAKESGSELIIFDIDTFGGRLDAAMEISEYISDLKGIKTVAFIAHKAISAGALIAVSCNDIVMAPEAELGDCEPILPSSEGGYKTAGEKIQTVLRTKFRKFAEKNGYPVLLAEAMVTSEIEVYRIKTEEQPFGFFITTRELDEMDEDAKSLINEKKLIIEKGKLLTMHAKEALEYGFARNIVDNREELLNLYDVYEADELDTNWSEEIARILEKIAPILLTIGIIAIYLEFKMPGFGIPGIVGILCFAALFLGKYTAGLAEAPEIIIFFIGIALIAVEIFLIPGFGITGIAGMVFVFIGLLLSFQDFTIPHTPYDSEVLQKNLLTIIASYLTSSVIILLLLKFIPGIPLFNRIILTTSETKDNGFYPIIDSSKKDLIGKKGVAITHLHPSGRIEIEDKILDVVTQGNFIDKGQRVEIVETEGNHIVVKSV